MKKIKVAVLSIIPVLLMAGCSALFDFNLFESFDVKPAPKASDYQGTAGLTKLSTDLQSPAVVAALTADPTTTAQIATELLTTINTTTTVTTPEQQQAVILYGDLNLKTTPGEALVNNIVAALPTITQTTTTKNIQDIINQILPPEAKSSSTAFSSMANALLLANDQYLKLGAGLVDVNANGKIDPGEGVPPGTNMGDVAQKAATAFTMRILTNLVMNTAPGYSESAAISQMYLLATNTTAADAGLQNIAAPNPFDTASTDSYISANLPSVQRLFDCAGMPLPS